MMHLCKIWVVCFQIKVKIKACFRAVWFEFISLKMCLKNTGKVVEKCEVTVALRI